MSWSVQAPNRCEHVCDADAFDNLLALLRRESSICEECGVADSAVSRLLCCLACGKVLCWMGSVYDHATLHYEETDHPIALSLAQRAPLRWCHAHQRAV
jgi:uncharacterized UBP type Zn finger protein